MRQFIKVRDLIKQDHQQLVKSLHGIYNIKFDDNKIVSLTSEEIDVLLYVWNIYDYKYEINSNYILEPYYKNGLLSGKTINQLLGVMKKDIVDNVIEPNSKVKYFDEIDRLNRDIFDVMANIYNKMLFKRPEAVTSIDLEDILEIQNDVELMSMMIGLRTYVTPRLITDVYDFIHKILTTYEKYENNALVIAYRAGIVNPNQVFQILGPRGYVTDMYSKIFKYPIVNSFAMGMNDLYSLVTESKSAAKALIQSTTAIQSSEEFGRLLQLVTLVVEDLVHTDCGSKEYFEFTVNKGDVPALDGKYYLDEETNQLRRLNGDTDEHLVGQTLKFRSPFKCKLKDPHKVCTTCFGGMSMNMLQHSNLGYLVAAVLNALLSQSILSTKHLTMSAAVANILYGDLTSKYFSTNGTKIMYNNELQGRKITTELIFTNDQVQSIRDLTAQNINMRDPGRLTSIDTFYIKRTDEITGRTDYDKVTISDGKKRATMDAKLLRHIVKYGYRLDSKDRYIVDISKWRYKTAMFNLPNVEFDYKALAGSISKSLKTIGNTTPEALTSSIFNTVNQKLFVNMAIVETVVYAFMVRDKSINDYGMGRTNGSQDLAGIGKITGGRSASVGYEMGALTQRLVSNDIFGQRHKPDHPFDVFTHPNEVLKAHPVTRTVIKTK